MAAACILAAATPPAGATILGAPWHPAPSPTFALHIPHTEVLGPQLHLGTHGAIFGLSAPYGFYVSAEPLTPDWTAGWQSDSYLAFGAAAVGRVVIVGGRASLAWGPNSPGGLLFSDSSGPFDLVQVRGQWRAVRFSRTLGWLDAGRSVIATRFDIAFGQKLRVAFNEAILMDGPPYLPYLLAPSPVVWNQYIAQELRPGQDNHLLSFDVEWIARPGLRLFGELLIDDFTVPTPTANFPSRWGLTMGAHRVFGTGGGDLKAVYTIVPNWTYSSTDPNLHYELRGRPLGHPLGADFDALHLRWAPTEQAAYWATMIRKGEGQVGRIWVDEAEARQFIFLRGVVEYSLIVGLDREVGKPGEWDAVVSPWVAYRTNADHVPGATRLDWGVGLQFTKSY